MAKVVNKDAVWMTVDTDTLSVEQGKAYNQYKALYREMKAQREAFEQSMARGVPHGERMIFGYNFGKLSIAVVKDDREPKKVTSVKAGSLADYLAARAAAGQSH